MTGTPARRRHSPAVYRRRRLAVLIIALLVIGTVVWLLVAQPWSGSASEKTDDAGGTGASSLPAVSSQATPGSGATGATEGATEGAVPEGDAAGATPGATAAAKPCSGGDIAVEAVTDQDTYQPSQNPQFYITLTNNGSDCTLNVGTSTQSFTVMSGDDAWWRSTDCQSEPSDMTVLLSAGQTVSSAAPVGWDRTRSAVGTCEDETRPLAPGGGASYHLSVEIGGVASTDSKQFLLY